MYHKINTDMTNLVLTDDLIEEGGMGGQLGMESGDTRKELPTSISTPRCNKLQSKNTYT